MIVVFWTFFKDFIRRYIWKFIIFWILSPIIIICLDKYGLREHGIYSSIFSAESSSSIQTINERFRNFPLNLPEMRKLFPSEEMIPFHEFVIFGFFVFIFPIPFIIWSTVVYSHALLGAPLWDWQFTFFFYNEHSITFRPGKAGPEWLAEILRFVFYQYVELHMKIYGWMADRFEPKPITLKKYEDWNVAEKFWIDLGYKLRLPELYYKIKGECWSYFWTCNGYLNTIENKVDNFWKWIKSWNE